MTVDAKPWQQPLFMVYDVGTDERVPLTQERLDVLLRVERQYGMMISDIRKSHEALVTQLGGTPQSWAGK